MNIQTLGPEASNAVPLVAHERPATETAKPAAPKTSLTQDKTVSLSPQEQKEETHNAIEKISNFVKASASDLQFSVDDETGSPVVKVIDRTTKEVIRQIPSQEAIEISKALDKLAGLLIKNQA